MWVAGWRERDLAPPGTRKGFRVSNVRAILSAAVAAAVAAFSLAGCQVNGRTDDASPASTPGSWTGEMHQAYDSATSPEIKEALKDGTISDREYAEMTERYTKCLAAAGISLTRYGTDGGSYDTPAGMTSDDAHTIDSGCSDDSGEYPIGYFYVQMRANPSHRNMAEAIVECFKKKKLVGPGYGLKDYQAGDLPSDNDPAVATCSSDPEGRLGG